MTLLCRKSGLKGFQYFFLQLYWYLLCTIRAQCFLFFLFSMQLLMSLFENAMKSHNVLENDPYDWEKGDTEDMLTITASATTAQQLTRITPAYLGSVVIQSLSIQKLDGFVLRLKRFVTVYLVVVGRYRR